MKGRVTKVLIKKPKCLLEPPIIERTSAGAKSLITRDMSYERFVPIIEKMGILLIYVIRNTSILLILVLEIILRCIKLFR